MKVIIEASSGKFYCYRETEKHFKKAEKQRSHLKRRVDFNKDCQIENNEYAVIDVGVGNKNPFLER